MTNFYAVGWQAPSNGQLIGQPKNFRKAVIADKYELENFKKQLQFSGTFSKEESLVDRFKEAITGLENLKTNGNNTTVPFIRLVNDLVNDELMRINIVSQKLIEQLPVLKKFESIRFYIITENIDGIKYRFYIKALRTANLKTRFVMTSLDGKIQIVDTKDNGKALPYMICYAEQIVNGVTNQYIFNVQDYEEIFGINESKVKFAEQNFEKFLSGNVEEKYRISEKYEVQVSNEERLKIKEKIGRSRKLVNQLAKYTGEATEYEWEDVKMANELASNFMQQPFLYDEDDHQIMLTAESLDAFISVISNTKKLGISKHEYEDSLANNRAS